MTNKLNLPQPVHIKLRKYLVYGSLESGHQAIEIILRVYLLIYYTEQVKLSPLYTTAALGIAVFWDAITDPVMGLISDKYKKAVSRPLQVLIGGLLTGIFFLMLFNPPSGLSQIQTFGYLLVSYLMLNTGYTVATIPYVAMVAEMTESDQYRTNFFGSRIFFGNLGLVLGSALPAVFIMSFPNSSYSVTSYALAAYLLLISVLFYFYFKNVDYVNSDKKPEIFNKKMIVAKFEPLLNNKNYLILLLAYFVTNMGLAINSALALYYYKYTLHIDEVTTKWIIVFFLLIFSLSLVFWVYSVNFLPLKRAMITGLFGLGLMTVVLYPLIPPNNLALPILACIIAGFFVGCVVLLDTAIAKIADNSKQSGNEADYGLYFGIWRFSAKASRSIGIILTGFILKAVTLDINVINRPLAWFYGPGVGVFILLAGCILFYYKPEES